MKATKRDAKRAAAIARGYVEFRDEGRVRAGLGRWLRSMGATAYEAVWVGRKRAALPRPTDRWTPAKEWPRADAVS